MLDPIFLSDSDVLAIHADQINQYGGSHGIRDTGLFESAMAQPQASFGGAFLHQDIFSMAAAYAFHLISDHPFLDGNKRVGAMAAFVFLSLNGFDLNASEDQFELIILRTASGSATKDELADFFKRNSNVCEVS